MFPAPPLVEWNSHLFFFLKDQVFTVQGGRRVGVGAFIPEPSNLQEVCGSTTVQFH